VCDIAVVVRPGRVLFAKNSDRDANEAQALEWHPRRDHEPGARTRCTWIEIDQARRTHATLLSRPFWMWGAEVGANEHGLVVGNVAVFTRNRVAAPGLTGMDLVRLALERAESSEEGVRVIAGLLDAHGQGGGCGHENRRFSYHSSFVLADGVGAVLLETAGRAWTVEPVEGARTVSNALSIPGFADTHSDPVRTWGADALRRQACTSARASRADSPADLMALLRDHGRRTHPRYSWLNGALGAPCAHAGGLVAATQTTASWVSEITPEGASHWATATAAPCTGLFKPVRVETPLDLGPWPSDLFDDATLWWRHELLHRAVLRDPPTLLALLAAERKAVEARWQATPPEPADAFAEAERYLEDWTRRVAGVPASDTRPPWVRRYWRLRDRRSGLRWREPIGGVLR